MNQIQLSLRSADHPRTLKDSDGVPTFATVFALHNRKGRETRETLPITVKASHELAITLVDSLKKGTSFIVEGQLSYYKHPETHRESYSIWAERFTDITPPQSTTEASHHE
jgi:single-stranded DNA-binding protein